MEINRLKLANYLFQDEIMTQHILCRSDAESLSMRELLAIASQEDLIYGIIYNWDTHPF